MRSANVRLSLRLFGILAFVGGLGGCNDVRPVAPHEEPITDPTQLYMRLALDQRAINLSTAPGYNTLQLTATPRDALDNPMTGLPDPVFTTLDTTKITLTPSGMVTVRATGTAIKVFATLTAGSVTHKDSALINIKNLPTPPKLGSISIHPVPPDSAIWSVLEPQLTNDRFFQVNALINFLPFLDPPVLGYARDAGGLGYRLLARAKDTAGVTIAGLQVEYESLDSAVATVDRVSGKVSNPSLFPGQVRMVARTTAYGVVKADTVTFTVRTPYSMTVNARIGLNGVPVFEPFESRIAPYGYVGWFNALSDSVDIVFDDPTQVVAPPVAVCDGLYSVYVSLFEFPPIDGDPCSTGNAIAPGANPVFGPDLGPLFTLRLRQIKEPGVYTYRSMRTGATGRIIVTTDPTGTVD